jgi:hypothetical protein
MKPLRVPVPKTVTAAYLIPLDTAMTVTETRQRTIEAVGIHLPDPLRMTVLEWIRQGAVTIDVEVVPVERRRRPDGVMTEPAWSALARVTASRAASLIAIQEWQARGTAAALAASVGAPLIDALTREVLTRQEALASLPDTELDTSSLDVSIDFSLEPWVRVRGSADQEFQWAVSDGMQRFGLPEFRIGTELRVGGCERDIRKELEEILFGVLCRVWSGLVKDGQATPGAKGLVRMPRSVEIPAEIRIHRKDLDAARGVPNRGGSWATIGLRFDPSPHGPDWLTVCRPSGFPEGADLVSDVCHVLFGFERPTWYYMPQTGAVIDAVGSLPQARRRFRDGELPPGAQFMVRYEVTEDEGFRWAQVESWTDDDVVMVRYIGTELAPVVKVGRTYPVEAERVLDWAIWTDDKGAVEGARTEGLGFGF